MTIFPKVGPTPPPWLNPLYTHGRTDIQTDGDYTKRVVTPFGTTRLKIVHQLSVADVVGGMTHSPLPPRSVS